MKISQVLILLLILAVVPACSAAEIINNHQADVETVAMRTARSFLATFCSGEADTSVIRADMAHGGAWLVYVDMKCDDAEDRYLVYVAANGLDVLNHHPVGGD